MRFFNRELSWLSFNQRVLNEAMDEKHPLLERFRFLSITSSNLDEFFMVRVASLLDQVFAGFNEPDGAGMLPEEQIAAIGEKAHRMVEQEYYCYRKILLPLAEESSIYLRRCCELSPEQLRLLDNFYQRTIFPVLTPMVIDAGRPFPLVHNKSMNFILMLQNKNSCEDNPAIVGTLEVPAVLPRLIPLRGTNGLQHEFVLLEELLEIYLDRIFSGHVIVSSGLFRLTRNGDLGIDEEGAEDLLEAIEESLKRRKWGAPVRLEVEKGMDVVLLNILLEQFELDKGAVYSVNGPLDLTFLDELYGMKGFEAIKFSPKLPQDVLDLDHEESVFSAVRKGDILFHHPYHAFGPVISLVNDAADDPAVMAIKQTLYRVSGKSPMVAALARAAENGKQVTVLVELKARFDEENNIQWARRLEQAGCHVIYGLVGLKTHAKLLLIVRHDEDGIRRYVHMGTGNYNDVTARFYTDIGLMTCDPAIGADASALFNVISGYTELGEMQRLIVAPFALRNKIKSLIRVEALNAKAGKPASITAKLNSLVDYEIIEELYQASQAGVEINLIIRGICGLRPGVIGLSENIKVRSLVGRFLEHSRIFKFENDGRPQFFLSSADWMPRNLDRRLEVMFPVVSAKLQQDVDEILSLNLSDSYNAYGLCKDGSYRRIRSGDAEAVDSQEIMFQKIFELAHEKYRNIPTGKLTPVYSCEEKSMD
jgi:polyphosphate kinase